MLPIYNALKELYGTIFLMCIPSIPIFLAVNMIFGFYSQLPVLRICLVMVLIMLAYSMVLGVRFWKKSSIWLLREKAAPKEMSRLRNENAKKEAEIARLNMVGFECQAAASKLRTMAKDAIKIAEEKEQEIRAKDNEILKLTQALSSKEAQSSKNMENEHLQKQKETAVQRGSDVLVIVNNTFPIGKNGRHT